MTTSLGDLTLFFFGNTKDLERSLTEAKSKAMAAARDIEKAMSGVGKGFSLNPKVDHSELYALNKHLDLKKTHFDSLQAHFNRNPLTIKTVVDDTEVNDNLSRLGSGKSSKTGTANQSSNSASRESSAYIGLRTEVKQSGDRIVKAVIDSKKIGLLSQIKTGFAWGIGQSLSAGIGRSNPVQAISRAQRDLINKGAAFAEKPIKYAASGFLDNQELGQSVAKIKAVLSKNIRDSGYAIGDGIIAGIELSSGGIGKRLEAFYQAAVNPSRIKQDTKQSLDVIGKESGRGAAAVGRAYAKNTPSIAEPIGQALSKRRELALEERALPLARARALEILAQNRTKNSAKEVDQDTKELFIATGGYAGARGLSGDRIAKDIKKNAPEGSKAIWVKNSDTDISKESMGDMRSKSAALGFSLAKPHLRGYSKDALEMSAQAIAALERNPTIKIKFIGESGGGFAAEEAQKLMELAGYGDRSTYLGVGTPDFVGRLDTKSGKKIISPDEHLGAEAEVYSRYGLAKTPDYNLLGVEGHPIEHYREKKIAEVENFYQGAPQKLSKEEVGQIKQASQAFKNVDAKSLDSRQLSEMTNQAYANWQQMRRYLVADAGELTGDIEEIADTFKEFYLKFASQSSDVAFANQILNRVKEVYGELSANPGTEAYNTAQQLLKELQPYKEEISNKAKNSIGTRKEQFSSINKELNTYTQKLSDKSIGVKPGTSQQAQSATGSSTHPIASQTGKAELERARFISKQFRDAYGQLKIAIDEGNAELADGLAQQVQAMAEQARAEIKAITDSLGTDAAFGTELGNKLANAKGQITRTVNLSNRAVAKGRQQGKISSPVSPESLGVGENIAEGLGEGIAENTNSIKQIAEKMAEALIAAAEDILEIHSPSKVFARIGENVVKGLESGIKKAANVAEEAIKPIAAKLPEAAMEAMSQKPAAAPNAIFTNLIEGVNESINQGLEQLKKNLQAIPGGSLLTPLIDNFKEVKNAAVGAFVAFNTIKGLVDVLGKINEMSQAWMESAQVVESFGLQYRFVAGSVSEGAKSFEFARSEAKRLGTDVKAALQGFVGLEASAIETPLEGEGTKQIFSAFSQGSTVFDLTGEQQAGMFLGLKQMISQSRVGAEEMNQIAERMPGFWNMAARAMGMTVRQFRAASESGQLLAEDVLPRIAQQLSAETAGSVAASANSSVSAITRFNNATFEMEAALGTAFLPLRNTGLNAFASLLELVRENVGFFSKALEFVSVTIYILIAKNIGLLISSLGKIPGVAGFATKALESLAKASNFGQNKQKATDMLSGIGQGAQNFRANPIQFTGDILSGVGQGIKGKASDALGGIKASASSAKEALKDLMANGIGTASAGFGQMSANVKTFGKNAAVNGLAGLMSLTGAVRGLISAFAPLLLQFAVFEAAMAIFKMFGAALSDTAGDSRSFANAATEGLGKYRDALAEARGETEKFVDQSKRIREETLLDEAGFGWLFPKEIKVDDNWVNKARFAVGNAITGGITGTQKALGLQTWEDKKFDDQMIATSDARTATNEVTSQMLTQLGANGRGAAELGKLKEVDKQLAAIQVKRRGLLVTNPGDKEGIKSLDETQAKLLKIREQVNKPLGILQGQAQTNIDGLKKEIEKFEQLASKPGKNQEAYRQTLEGLKSDLKAAESAQDKFTKSIGEAATAFTLLQKNIKAVADDLADSGDRITIASSTAKANLSQQQITGDGLTPGQIQSRTTAIGIAEQTARTKKLEEAVVTQRGLLSTPEAQGTLADYQVDENTGQARLKTVSESATGNDKFYLESFANVKAQEVELAQAKAQLLDAKAGAVQQIRDANKQIAEYYMGVQRQTAELALSAKEAEIQLAAQGQKNRLKSALLGFQDSYITEFVDGIIESVDMLNQPLQDAIDSQKQGLQNRFSFEDQQKQALELKRSLPTMPTIEVGLDFSGIDSDGNVQKLEAGLQGTVETTKQLSEGHKQVVNAIASQFNPLYQVQQGIQSGVESSSELGQSILANATATGELGSEINANTLGLDDNLLKSGEVGQSLTGVVDTTGQVVAKTNELSGALGGVDMSTQNFGVSLASTGSVFDQLISKAGELAQTVAMSGAMSMGAGVFAPGMAVAADAAMGQMMQQGGGSGAKLGGAAAPGQPIFPIAGVSLEQANSKKTSPWGMRRHPVTGQMKMHRGQDYGFAEGTQVVSPTAGIVTKVAYQAGGAGKYVVVESLDEKGNKVEHKFFHLSAFDVKQGDKVQAGGKVGKVGATGIGTGAHLHYETWINGKNSDPLAYLAGNSGRGRLTQEQKNALGGHHPGDGHNHFGEDDIKVANQKAAAKAPAPVARAVGGGAGAPKLGQGYEALNELGGQLAQNKYFNPSDAAGRGRLAIALGIGGSEAFEKNTTRRSFYTYKGGTGNNMQGFGQFNNAYHKDIINTPEKYQNFFGQILAGERRLPNSQKGIGDYGAELTKAVQSGAIQNGQQLIKWMQANKLGGSNWQGVDDGWKRNPDLANQLVQYVKGSLPTQSGGGAMPTSAQAIQSAQATMAPVMQQAQITGSKLPPVTYNPRSALGLSGSSVNTRQLSAAEGQQAKNFEQQEGIRTAQLRSKLESDQIDFIKTQERNLRQLGVAGRESDDSALQSSRATEDMEFETGEPKSLGEQGQRKITEILRRFADREKELQRSISKTKDTIGAGEAAIASGEVTGANRTALEARLEAERKNLKGYESDLVKVQKLRGEAVASAEKLNQREQEIQDKANKASLEGAKIETLEAKLNYLKERQGRGERGGEIDGIPALEKLIGLKRQQAEYEQKIQAIDERVFKKEVSPEMAAQEKKEINDKLEINKKAITESAAYAEKVMGRENDKRSREERIGTMRGELAVMKEQLTTAKEAAQLNPQDPRAAWIPQAEKEVQLKEAALDLEEKIAAVEDKRFSKELTDEAANKQIENLKQENDALVKNIELRADRASKEAEFAARRSEAESKGFDVDLQSQLTEARSKNQELRGAPGFDPLKARYDIQSAQQTIGFTKQMIDLDELEASGKRTKEEIAALRAAYTELNNISLDNLKAEWEQAQQDKALGIQQKMVDSSTALMDARASGFSARGMTWKAREVQKDSAIAKQEMSYQQQTADLEKFIKSQGLSVEKAQQLRSELGQLNQVQLGNINAEFDPWTQQLGTMQGAFKGFFSDVLTGSKSIGDAFKGMVDQILGGLADMAAEWLTNKLFGDMFGMNKEGANPGQFYAGTLSNSQNPQQAGAQNPLNNIVPFGNSQGGGTEFGFATGMSIGTNPMQPMYVSDVSQSPLGGIAGGNLLGGAPDLFGSPDVGMGFVDSLFGSGETLPVNILGANDNFFSGMSDGLGGVLGGLFGGGSGGGMGGGIGSLIGGIGSLFGGGGGAASGGGGGLGGILSMGMNLLGGLFYDGGKVGTDGEKFTIANRVDGGIAGDLKKAIGREKAMNGGRPTEVAVLTHGERVLSLEQNRRFEQMGGMRVLNLANGGKIGNGSFAKSVGDKMSSNVNVSVPINVSGGGGEGGMDEERIRQVLDGKIRRVLEQESRSGGCLSARFSKR